MQDLNLFTVFIDKLNENNINYFVTGSIASILYGEPRLTHDIDLVISLKKNEVDEVDKILKAFQSEEFYCPPLDVIRYETLRPNRGHFNIIHQETGFKADFYLVGNDDFQLWGLQNKTEIEFLNKKIFIAPPEYVIIKKLEFFREGKSNKHLSDIQNMISISEERINFSLIEKFVKTFGLETEWTEVKNKN